MALLKLVKRVWTVILLKGCGLKPPLALMGKKEAEDVECIFVLFFVVVRTAGFVSQEKKYYILYSEQHRVDITSLL